MKKLLLIAAATLLLLNATAFVAAASEAGDRRVDTGNVVKADQGEHGSGGEEPGAITEAVEEAHHPVWMIFGWQTFFTILAVLYYAIAVKVLPLIMAKEEEGHH